MSIEWDGKGLPPVGCECEVKSEDFSDWVKIKVVYVHNGEIAAIVSALNPHLNDRIEKFSAGYNAAQFRPICTEEERWRENILRKLTDAICGDIPDVGMAWAYIYAARAFDAIAAGKIPGIRLTDDAGS